MWFTGLSGSGKSSVAMLVEQMLLEHGRPGLHSRRRQPAARPQRRPRLHAWPTGPRTCAGWPMSPPLLADCRADGAGAGDQPAGGAPRAGAQGAPARPGSTFFEVFCRHPAGRLRTARSQGSVRQGARRRDHPLHRHRQPVPAAEEPRPAADAGSHARRTGPAGHRAAGPRSSDRSTNWPRGWPPRPAGCCSACATSSPTPPRTSERPRATSGPTTS